MTLSQMVTETQENMGQENMGQERTREETHALRSKEGLKGPWQVHGFQK